VEQAKVVDMVKQLSLTRNKARSPTDTTKETTEVTTECL
jgi:hypothetical protein